MLHLNVDEIINNRFLRYTSAKLSCSLKQVFIIFVGKTLAVFILPRLIVFEQPYGVPFRPTNVSQARQPHFRRR